MKYPDGTEVRLGDLVKLSTGDIGLVVFSIDSGEYSEDFPKEEWSYLKKGIMVRTNKGALIHCDDPNVAEILLVHRA